MFLLQRVFMKTGMLPDQVMKLPAGMRKFVFASAVYEEEYERIKWGAEEKNA